MTHPLLGATGIKLELDDGTGTFPYDITAYLDMKAGYTIKRGRPDQFSTVQASELNLILKNDDGRFTVGNTTYAVSPFIDQRIRLTETIGATVSVRFTGYVSGWPVSWEGGPAKIATARVQAFDAFTRLNRKTMIDRVEAEMTAAGAYVYVPLNEPATAAVPSARTQTPGAAPFSPINIAGTTAPSFGNPIAGVADATTTAAAFSGSYFQATPASFAVPTSTGTTLMALFKTTLTPAFHTGFVDVQPTVSGSVDLVLRSDGKLMGGLGSAVSATAVNDGNWHFAAFRTNGTVSDLWLDGAVASGSVHATIAGLVLSVDVGGSPIYIPAANFFGSVATVGLTNNYLTNAQLAGIRASIFSGNAGESSADRFTRLAGYGGIAATDVLTETPALAATPAQDVVGQNPLAALQAVADAEGGLAFIRGDGKLIMQNRYHRAQRTAANLSLTTDDLTTDLEVEYDMDEVTNYATGMRALVTSATDTPTLVSQSATSITRHGQYPNQMADLLVTTDQEVQDRLDWTVNRYAEPFPRLPDCEIDLLTSSNAKQQSALVLELSDRLSIGTLPAQAPTVGDLVVEGWTEKVSISEWSLAINASPFSVVTAFILDDATYGVLDSTVAPLSF